MRRLPANLSALVVDMNLLTGTIPDEWRSANNLADVTLWGNFLTGGFPIPGCMLWHGGHGACAELAKKGGFGDQSQNRNKTQTCRDLALLAGEGRPEDVH